MTSATGPSIIGKRPPLSPRDDWLSDGRQVMYFRPVVYSRFSQALELSTGHPASLSIDR